MNNTLILPIHKKLLAIVATGESTHARGDGWRDTGVNICHGNIVKSMGTNGWPPILKLAEALRAASLIESVEESGKVVKTTQAGRDFLNGAASVVRQAKSAPLDIVSLHSRVREVSESLVLDGHYRQAITDTFIALDDYVKQACGLSENGTPLMQKAFSANDPVLILSADKEEQMGFMMLFAGAIKAIRNQYAHSLVNPQSKEATLEWLGFASALFRLVDQAKKK